MDMAEVIIGNMKRGSDGSNGCYPSDDGKTGMGMQFILYSPAVVSRATFKFQKLCYNLDNPPAGTFTARIYNSNTGIFRDYNDYAVGLVAESTNSIDVGDLGNYQLSDVVFTFNDVALPAGIYFICLWSENFVHNDSSLNLPVTENPSALVGSGTWWGGLVNRWLCSNED